MPPRKQSATVDLKLRIKEPLRVQIEKAAKQHGVSMNMEMVARLQRSFERDKINELESKIDAIMIALQTR